MNKKVIKQYLEYLELTGIRDIFFEHKPNFSIDPKEVKSQKLKNLENTYKSCNKCELSKSRNKFCYGNGNPNAKLMLIGEGPGADEDRTGKVFVGRAGQLLTRMLKAIDLQRDDVYITNIVKCRPPNNRNPLQKEKESCIPYLEEQISIIQPKLILLLGKVAAISLLNKNNPLKKFRKTTHKYKNIKTYVSYHPAALLRNPKWKKFAWVDLQKIQIDYNNLS